MDTHNSLTLSAGADGFGDGSHPTTAGVLAALESIDPTLFCPRIACDIGCGSGILAFSIIRLFKCFVVAVDNSKQAIEIVRINAHENGIKISDYAQGDAPCVASHGEPEGRGSAPLGASWSEAERTSLRVNGIRPPSGIYTIHAEGFAHPAITAAAPFDLITMNILAAPLLALAGDAERHLAPGGVLILSGIFLWQEPQIRGAYQSLSLELTSRLTLGDWVTLVWQKAG